MQTSHIQFLRLAISAFAVLAAVSCVHADTSGVLPLGIAEFESVYDRMERIATLSRDTEDYQLGPYRFDILPSSSGPFGKLRSAQRTKVVVFGNYREDIRASRYATGRAYESVRGGFAGRPTDKLFIFANFALDELKAKDHDYTGKKWRGLAGDVEQAFVYYQSGKLGVQAGRFASFWGVRRSLLLGSNAIMDGFAYNFKWGRLTASYRLARLDGLSPERTGTATFENRYLAGHRFDFHVSQWLRLGLSEMVVFGGPGRQLDLAYLNPILFYHSTQLNGMSDDNTLVGVDFDVKPGRSVRCYGQLLVDDFQIEKKTQSDQEPDEYGFILGTYAADILPHWDLRVEYSRVTNWTYDQILPRNRYLFNGKPISAALGNDYDLFNLALIRWLNDNLRGSLDFSYYRQGEGTPSAIWSQPWLDMTGDYSEPFPTGVVQRAASASLGLKGFVKGPFFVDLETGLQRVSNFAHIRDNDRTIPFVNLLVSAFFSADLDIR